MGHESGFPSAGTLVLSQQIIFILIFLLWLAKNPKVDNVLVTPSPHPKGLKSGVCGQSYREKEPFRFYI